MNPACTTAAQPISVPPVTLAHLREAMTGVARLASALIPFDAAACRAFGLPETAAGWYRMGPFGDLQRVSGW